MATPTTKHDRPAALPERRPSQMQVHRRQDSQVASGSSAPNISTPRAVMHGSTNAGLQRKGTVHGASKLSNGDIPVPASEVTDLNSTIPPVPKTTSSSQHLPTTRSRTNTLRNAHPAKEPALRRNPSVTGRVAQEVKSTADHCLHILLTRFCVVANSMISEYLRNAPSEPVENVCGPGVNALFDQTIKSLGHVARRSPDVIIESLMHWRKGKKDELNLARKDLERNGSVRNFVMSTRPSLETANSYTLLSGQGRRQPDVQWASPMLEAVEVAERKANTSVYLLCRALIEVIKQPRLNRLSSKTAEQVETVIFHVVRSADPEQLAASSLKSANWALCGELLGLFSDIRFESVATRIFNDLDDAFSEMNTKGHLLKEIEARIEVVVLAIRYVKPKTSTASGWDRSCEFLYRVGQLYQSSHGQRIKHAYCQALERLLVPIAAGVHEGLSQTRWRDILSMLSQRTHQLLQKPKHWAAAFPLQVMILCVSPPEIFHSNWMQCLHSANPKLKDRGNKILALQGMCRLAWTYLYRCPEAADITLRKLDDLTKLLFTSTRKSLYAFDSSTIEPLVQLIRILGCKHREFCMRSIIFPLLNADQILRPDIKVSQLEPDKIIIGIRSFLAVVDDSQEPMRFPSFPSRFDASEELTSGKMNEYAIGNMQGVRTGSSDPHARKRSGSTIAPMQPQYGQPIQISTLREDIKPFFEQFCGILGRIAMICDDSFGGRAALDEKFSINQPKTPTVESFATSSRKEEQVLSEQKQSFYELIRVAIEALPRCITTQAPLNPLINLLYMGTVHVQPAIAACSAYSLGAIARRANALPVISGFARFSFNLDHRYLNLGEGMVLAPDHIEKTLQIYIELLKVWLDELRSSAKEASEHLQPGQNRPSLFDWTKIQTQVDDVESDGLFFLCSQSRHIRTSAIAILRLIVEFDHVLQQKVHRLIHLIESDVGRILELKDEILTTAERTRLQRNRKTSQPQNTLIELCESPEQYNAALWRKAYPNFLRLAFWNCPSVVALTRKKVCHRLSLTFKAIKAHAEAPRIPPFEASGGRQVKAIMNTSDSMIEQWRIHLIFACITVTSAGGGRALDDSSSIHSRKASRPPTQQHEASLETADGLYSKILPLLSTHVAAIREAAVAALGFTGENLYRSLLAALQHGVNQCNEEARSRPHQRSVSTSRKPRRYDLLRTEIANVYRLTSHHLLRSDKDGSDPPSSCSDEWVMNNLAGYAKDLRLFLASEEVQYDPEYQQLRRHYCGFIEQFYEGVRDTSVPIRWMSFEARKSAFTLMEEWCGFSQNETHIRDREEHMRRSIRDQYQDSLDDRGMNALMAKEKKELGTAALSAMASLCGGPLVIATASGSNLQFDVRLIYSWIDAIFATNINKNHEIGRRAFQNLIMRNPERTMLFDRCIHKCYTAESSDAANSYFEIVSEVIRLKPQYPVAPEQILALCIFSLGNDNQSLRQKATRLLRSCEALKSSILRIQEYDIAILDKTKTVYKDAQYGISEKLAQQHSDLAILLFSEFSASFQRLRHRPQVQRNMVGPMLPWTCNIELQVDTSGRLTSFTHMILMNMFELTMRTGNIFLNETNALWLSFASGPHGGNIQLIIDFVMALCLDRLEPRFIEVAKQVVVCLAGTKNDSAKHQIIEYLLLKITYKSMVFESHQALKRPSGEMAFAYVANLTVEQIPNGMQQRQMSLGQLALILLVDLVVTPAKISDEQLPTLLHSVFVLWDHTTTIIQDHAREMLLHLIHELVISQTDLEIGSKLRHEADKLIENIRSEDSSVIWSLNDNPDAKKQPNLQPPRAMISLSLKVIDIFKANYPELKQRWGRIAVHWATNCQVQSIARKSLQVFRCIVNGLETKALPEILERLSHTIADGSPDVQAFSLEILATFGTIITKIPPIKLLSHPQLFWTVCACFESPSYDEFAQCLQLLEQLTNKLDLSSESVCKSLLDAQPAHWSGNFVGIQSLLQPGLRSQALFEKTTAMLQTFASFPDHPLLGSEDRAVFLMLVSYAQLAQWYKDPNKVTQLQAKAAELEKIATRASYDNLAEVMRGLQDSAYRTTKELYTHYLEGVRIDLLPFGDFPIITFLQGLLTNNTDWIRNRILQLLNGLIPYVDLKKRAFAEHGVDLISPLLHLLDTDQYMQALDVLDKISFIASVPNDRLHLRRSAIGIGAIKDESHQSLYGSPEPDGWAAPAPKRQTETTRANIQAIYYHPPASRTAATTTSTAGARDPAIPEVVAPDADAPPPPPPQEYIYRSFRQTSPLDSQGITNKLDELDTFLSQAKLAMQTAHTLRSGGNSHSANQTSPYSPVALTAPSQDRRDEIYDREVYPILSTLHRQPSSASVYIGKTDSRPATASGPGSGTGTTTVTAIAPPSALAGAGTLLPPSTSALRATPRPGMALRSVTSPVQPATPAPFVALGPLSDGEGDDAEAFPTLGTLGPGIRLGHEGSLSADGLAGIKEAVAGRLTARKLTNGSAREREREKGGTPPPPAPQVGVVRGLGGYGEEPAVI